MLKLIDPKSQHAILPELDLQALPSSQTGVINSRWRKCTLSNTLVPTSTGPFHIQLGMNNKHYISLKRSWLVWTFSIRDNTGAPIPVNAAGGGGANPVVGPIQNIGAAIPKQVILELNSVITETSDVNLAFRTYMENELMLSTSTKEANLSISGYKTDTRQDSERNTGYTARAAMCQNGARITVCTRLPLDLAAQNKLLLNFIDARLTIFTNSPRFLLEQYGANPLDRQFHIHDVHVLLNEYELADGFSTAIEKNLLTHPIQYALNSVQMRTLYISEGRLESPPFQCFQRAPKRIVVGLVSAAAFNGDYARSPFNFQHFHLSDITVDVSGVTYPANPWRLDFANNKYHEAFLATQEALGFARSNETNGITYEKFKKGWAMYALEISPTIHDPDLFDLIRQGTVSIKFQFSQAVAAGGYYAVILGEIDSILSIDASRTPHLDSII